MPRRNYGYEKRQKELNRQSKQEQKRQRKLDRREVLPEEGNVNVDEATAGGDSPESESV